MLRRRRVSWWTRRGTPLLVAAAILAAVAVMIAGMRMEPTRPAKPVVITSSEWAPYVGPELPGGGPMAELVTMALARQGYQATVDFTTWDLALDRSARGQAAGAAPMVASAEREQVLSSEPLADFEYVLFYDRADPPAEGLTLDDLADLRVARIAGYDYWPELDEAVGSYLEFDTGLDAFVALSAGEVDLVPEGRLAGEAILDSPDLAVDAERFTYLEDDSFRSLQSLHFLVADTSANRDLMEGFNAALAQVRLTPEYRDLIGRLQSAGGGEQVVLRSADGELPVLVDENGAQIAVLPQGTRAHVMEWPAGTGSGSGEAGDLLVQIKISDGPGRGRMGFVDLATVELEQR